MRACMTASGGAMFIPDTIARKKCKISYKSLVDDVTEDNNETRLNIEKAPAKNLNHAAFSKSKEVEEINIKAA